MIRPYCKQIKEKKIDLIKVFKMFLRKTSKNALFWTKSVKIAQKRREKKQKLLDFANENRKKLQNITFEFFSIFAIFFPNHVIFQKKDRVGNVLSFFNFAVFS